MKRATLAMVRAGLLWLLLASAPVQGQAWRFVVFGDTRGESTSDQIDTTILSEIARAATNYHPAFVLVPGDLVNSGTPAAFQSWTNVMAPVYQAGIAVYPVIGNHDLPSVPGWTNVFGSTIPNNGPATEIDRTYFITYSNALILNLDTYVNVSRVNQGWINAVLATNTRPHVFVQGHEPAFKANHPDCLDNYPKNRNVFWNSLSNANCRIYFTGHDHFYNHSRIDDGDGNPDNDVHQMIVGSGGAPISTTYAYDGNNSFFFPRLIFHEQQYGFVVVEVSGFQVTTTWYHRTSLGVYAAGGDVFSYTAVPVRPVIAVSRTGLGLTLKWSGGGTLQAAGTINGVFADVPGAASPFVVTNAGGTAMFYRIRQ